MARRRALSSREVDALREVGMHWISDNLYLQIRDQGTRSWLLRIPMKPAIDSETKPATCSDFIPASIPI